MLIRTGIRGFLSVSFRNTSFTETKYFALVATRKMSLHSLLGATSTLSQKVGIPATADGLKDVVTSTLFGNSRSVMVKLRINSIQNNAVCHHST